MVLNQLQKRRKKNEMFIVIVVSDTHGQHKKLPRMSGNLLIHSGDFTNQGEAQEIRNFNFWLQEQEEHFDNILLVAGNHDVAFCPIKKSNFVVENNKRLLLRDLSKTNYLMDEAITINNKVFYGVPWQPEFFNWGFNLPRNGQQLKEVWDKIPENTDFLITHGPPFSILDKNERHQNCGCELLLDRVLQLKNLKYHLFGHIHEGYGIKIFEGKTFMNASSMNEKYHMVNAPLYFDMDDENDIPAEWH